MFWALHSFLLIYGTSEAYLESKSSSSPVCRFYIHNVIRQKKQQTVEGCKLVFSFCLVFPSPREMSCWGNSVPLKCHRFSVAAARGERTMCKDLDCLGEHAFHPEALWVLESWSPNWNLLNMCFLVLLHFCTFSPSPLPRGGPRFPGQSRILFCPPSPRIWGSTWRF